MVRLHVEPKPFGDAVDRQRRERPCRRRPACRLAAGQNHGLSVGGPRLLRVREPGRKQFWRAAGPREERVQGRVRALPRLVGRRLGLLGAGQGVDVLGRVRRFAEGRRGPHPHGRHYAPGRRNRRSEDQCGAPRNPRDIHVGRRASRPMIHPSPGDSRENLLSVPLFHK